jgi:hypothetical protein
VKAGNILQPERTVHISRVSMLPFEQDIFDEHGQVVTRATYDNYQKYGDEQFPSLINIVRPIDEYSLKIEVTKLKLNGTFDDDQFQLEIPASATVQKMK